MNLVQDLQDMIDGKKPVLKKIEKKELPLILKLLIGGFLLGLAGFFLLFAALIISIL